MVVPYDYLVTMLGESYNFTSVAMKKVRRLMTKKVSIDLFGKACISSAFIEIRDWEQHAAGAGRSAHAPELTGAEILYVTRWLAAQLFACMTRYGSFLR